MKRIFINEEWCLGCHLCEYQCAYANSGIDDMVKALKEAGFAGIYIDRRAYLAEQIEQLESDLTEATGTKPVISDNGLSLIHI